MSRLFYSLFLVLKNPQESLRDKQSQHKASTEEGVLLLYAPYRVLQGHFFFYASVYHH